MNARFLSVAVAMLVLTSVGLLAHDVPVEQLVTMTATSQPNAVRIGMRVPKALVNDALALASQSGNSAQALDTIAASVVRDLDLRDGDASISPSSLTARQVGDPDTIEIDATYPTANWQGLSVRLNVFDSKPLMPVRTVLDVRAEGLPGHAYNVTGAATRVLLEPDTWDAMREAVSLAIGRVLGWADQILMLICIVVPLTRSAQTPRLVALMLGGQAIGLAAAGLTARNAVDLIDALTIVAASAVVIAAIQVVVRARLSLVLPVVVGFALLNGIVIGTEGLAQVQFAGSHTAVGTITFAVMFLVLEMWLAAILWFVRGWLDARKAPAWGFETIVSCLVAHEAIHHCVDASQRLSEADPAFGGHALVVVALGWVVLTIFYGVVLAVTARSATPVWSTRPS